jgi:hypothetical protein
MSINSVIAADSVKGFFGPEEAKEGTLAAGLEKYGSGIVAAG